MRSSLKLTTAKKKTLQLKISEKYSPSNNKGDKSVKDGSWFKTDKLDSGRSVLLPLINQRSSAP